MASGNPDNETELDDPKVDVSGMIAEVGGESGATVQAPTLRTHGQFPAARLARQDRDATCEYPVLQHLSGVSDGGSDCESASVSVGAPTRAHRVNDRSAPAFDMNAFELVLSQYTSQHMPTVNLSGGKAAAIAKSDKPKWDVKTELIEPFHTFQRRVMSHTA